MERNLFSSKEMSLSELRIGAYQYTIECIEDLGEDYISGMCSDLWHYVSRYVDIFPFESTEKILPEIHEYDNGELYWWDINDQESRIKALRKSKKKVKENENDINSLSGGVRWLRKD